MSARAEETTAALEAQAFAAKVATIRERVRMARPQRGSVRGDDVLLMVAGTGALTLSPRALERLAQLQSQCRQSQPYSR